MEQHSKVLHLRLTSGPVWQVILIGAIALVSSNMCSNSNYICGDVSTVMYGTQGDSSQCPFVISALPPADEARGVSMSTGATSAAAGKASARLGQPVKRSFRMRSVASSYPAGKASQPFLYPICKLTGVHTAPLVDMSLVDALSI